jgi:integrase
VEEFRALFGKLTDRERAMGIICATAFLRISETLSLKWEDIDFGKGQANVVRSVVEGEVSDCKTEVSQQPVPLDGLTLEELKSWKRLPKGNNDRKRKKIYEGNLKNHIEPRWGSYRIRDIASTEVEEWFGRA